jgi:predicted DNA-binding antitoxin AbrB/MazE fold protein
MTTQFPAIVEQGVLRPLVPVSLQEGITVTVIVRESDQFKPTSNPAEILARIAALPSIPGDPTAGDRHDEILYGDEEHRP